MPLFVVQQQAPPTPTVGRRVRRWLLRAGARALWAILRWLLRRAFTYRRALAPLYAAGVFATTAAVLGTYPDGPETAAVVAVGAAGGVYGWARWRNLPHRDLLARQQLAGGRRVLRPAGRKVLFAWALWAATSVWLVVAASVGVTAVPVRTVLAAGLVVFGGAWWWHHHFKPAVEDPGAWHLQVWEEELAGSGRPLRGAQMRNLAVRGRDDFDFEVALRRQQTRHLVDARGDIAAAYGLPVHAVIVEPAPDERNDEGRVIVARHNPTHDVIEYDESWIGMVEGCYQFHTYPDGERGRLRLFESRSGAAHALYSGDNRMGKSEGMATSCTQGAMSGLTVPVIIDSQDGLSMPAWGGPDGHAPYKATGNAENMDDVVDLFCAVAAGAIARQRHLSHRPWSPEPGVQVRGMGFYDPELVPELPILDVYLPEVQRFLAVEGMPEMVANAVVTWAKLGIRLSLDTQYPGVENLGGSMALRANLSQNIVAYRNSAKTAGGMILSSWMPVPHEIPRTIPGGGTTKGWAVIETSAPDSSRATYSRSVLIRNGWKWAARAAEHIPPLDDMTREAIEQCLAERRKAREAAKAKAAELARKAAEERGDETAPELPMVPVGSVRERAILHLAEHELHRATTGAIAQAIGATPNAVSTALRRAAEKGDVVDLGHAMWGAVGVDHRFAEIGQAA